jgi:predicted nucleic acid-binding protein
MEGNASVIERLNRLLPTDLLFTSVISEAEIEYGILNSSDQLVARRRKALDSTLPLFVEVLPITREVAISCARARFDSIRSGRPIPDNDLWIAAVAIANDMTLIHRDYHFTYVPGLRQEDWSDPV